MNVLVKDWREMYRSQLFSAMILLIIVMSIIIIRQFAGIHIETSFSALLVPLFQINLYLIPFIAMIVSAFSILQEKSQKTLPMLLVRFYSPTKFLFNKSIAVNAMMFVCIFVSYFLVMAISQFMIGVKFVPFLQFVFATFLLSVVFTQIGILLGALFENKLQVLGSILFIWFFFIFMFDLTLMYFIPNIQNDEIFAFSVFYFLSPINAVQYFFLVQVDVYQLSSFSALFDHLTFKQPLFVVAVNLIVWISSTFLVAVRLLKNRGVSS